MSSNAFSDALGLVGVDAFFGQQEGDQYSVLRLDDIDVNDQVRTEFEDSESSLAEMAESIKAVGVLQPVLVRPLPSGRYELVAGERRYRASRLAGKDTIPVLIREMTDEQVEEAQLAENIQRKNLTQMEIARRLQRDLDRLDGDIDALMAKHHKSRGWISKMLGLLNLPEQTQRLVDEDVSADLAVIGAVKVIEKVDPQAARELVDDLKAGRTKGNARDLAQAAKERVKPLKGSADAGSVATPRDRSSEAPGPVATGHTGKWTERQFEAVLPLLPKMTTERLEMVKRYLVDRVGPQALAEIYSCTRQNVHQAVEIVTDVWRERQRSIEIEADAASAPEDWTCVTICAPADLVEKWRKQAAKARA